MKQYFVNILIAIDQLFTTLFGGYPDETISSYLWRLEQQKKLAGIWFRPVIDWLFQWQGPNHCMESMISERARVQLPPELRNPV